MYQSLRQACLSSSALLMASVASAQIAADPMDLMEIRDLSERAGEGSGFVTGAGTNESHLQAKLVDQRGEVRYLAEARMNAFEESFSTRIEQGYVSGYLYPADATGQPFEAMEPVGILSGFWSLNSDGSGQLEALMVGRNEATSLAEAFGYMSGAFQVSGSAGGGSLVTGATSLGGDSGASGPDGSEDGPLIFPPPPGASAMQSHTQGSYSSIHDYSNQPIVDPGPLPTSGMGVYPRQDEGRLPSSDYQGIGESGAGQQQPGSSEPSSAAPPGGPNGQGDISGSGNPADSGSYGGTFQPNGQHSHPYGDDMVYPDYGPGVEVNPGSDRSQGSVEAAPGDLSSRSNDTSSSSESIGAITLQWGLVD